jgi:hypothetical protein
MFEKKSKIKPLVKQELNVSDERVGITVKAVCVTLISRSIFTIRLRTTFALDGVATVFTGHFNHIYEFFLSIGKS